MTDQIKNIQINRIKLLKKIDALITLKLFLDRLVVR